jgi:hypothetical protein
MSGDSRAKAAQSLILGRTRFAKISAIEGIRLSSEALKEFQEDEHRQATTAERRQRILAKYSTKK